MEEFVGEDEAHEPARDFRLIEDGVNTYHVGERVVASQTQGVTAATAGPAAPGQFWNGPILSKMAFEALGQNLLCQGVEVVRRAMRVQSRSGAWGRGLMLHTLIDPIVEECASPAGSASY